MKKTNTLTTDRRQFLRNVSLASISMGLVPVTVKGSPGDRTPITCDPTTLDFYGEGPFYTPNPPDILNNQLADQNESGTRLIVSGRVHNLDCTEIIPGTVIDVWHADDSGAYDNVGYNLRGVTESNSQGFYMFETILKDQ